ncbi:phospholipase D-like domain-containing protein [Hydrogenophaga sp.]|uniref:phospholipase D-like domain-containing protein n=1 Tax=Hydrogenophaga sp. TaxID=1904254 RepID=UPI0025B7E619|nr:phospholipase D-like domain-containing protein [Hydrogenophaga sp.]
MNFFHWLTAHGLVMAIASLVYVVHSHVMQQRRQPSAAIAWMLFILLVPYLALPAYLIFGSRKLPRPGAQHLAEPMSVGNLQHWAIDTLVALGQPAPAAYTDLQVHAGGEAAQNALLSLLASARKSIDVCTFILARDPLGEAVVNHLCERARAGVRVRLLLDGMGSLMRRPPDLQRLLDAGGTFALFVSPLRSPLKGRTNLRDHRKLVLVDADEYDGRLWSGGRNLAAEYFQGLPGAMPWRDLSFELGGPVIGQAVALFEHDWRFARGLPPDSLTQSFATVGAVQQADGAQLVASGPDQADDTVHALLVSAAYRAQRRMSLATPYFVPDAALLMALCMAARRGVRVDLLLPARSNHRLSDFARGRALRALAQAGGQIWLTKGMLHGKLVVVDESLALAGSANLDSRSLFINYELMFAFHLETDVGQFQSWFDSERADAKPFSAQPPGLLRDTLEGLLLWTGFQL